MLTTLRIPIGFVGNTGMEMIEVGSKRPGMPPTPSALTHPRT